MASHRGKAGPRTCSKCKVNPIRSTPKNNARYCQECHDTKPDHTGRVPMPPIIAQVDLEGLPNPDHLIEVKVNGVPTLLPQMGLICVAVGFEDGCSTSLWSDDPREIMRWIVDTIGSGARHHDRLIVAQGFHFGWDSAVLTRDFDPNDMELIQKVGTTQHNAVPLCGRLADCECERIHRYRPEDIQAVITNGGEDQLVAWDRKSELAFALTPRRRTYIERRPHGDRFEQYQRVDIHDVGTAFPPPYSLEAVIEDWRPDISLEQRAAIAWGKQARTNGFKGATPEQVMTYSKSECVAAAKSVRKLIDTIERATGITIDIKRVYGSGSIANQVFNHHGVPKLKDTASSGMNMAGLPVNLLPMLDYFGGMIETPVVGRIVGPVDQEDLNSAYPAQMAGTVEGMAGLPCMRSGHGQWIKRQGDLDIEAEDVLNALSGKKPIVVGHVLATWDWTAYDTSTAPFEVHLKDGAVRTPLSGYKVVVTMARYRAAKREHPSDTFADAAVWWEQTCNCPPPFGWMLDLYEKRNEIKAQMKTVEYHSAEWWDLNQQQLAIKLILNSGYGKLAQQRPVPGPFTNLHYASAITGGTRAAVAVEAWRLERTGGIIIYQHTDSELFIGGEKLPHTKALGGWGQEDPTHDQLVMQPGLSISLASPLNERGRPTEGKNANRGCDAAKFAQAAHGWVDEADLTRHPITWPPALVEQERMVSRRLAIFQGHPERAGCFLPHNLNIRVASQKRDFERARPMPGQPEAWIVPPLQFVPLGAIATIADMQKYNEERNVRLTQGLEEWGVDLDDWLVG